jgi:GNAT superfamily N-acetyltransferase
VNFRLEARPYEDAQVQALVAAVQAEYVARYGGPDEAAVEPGEFDPPDGLFLVGYLDGVAVATGGWRRLAVDGTDSADGTDSTADTVEIKRMFVLDSARRRGLARRVLAELEATAAGAGARRVVLNTGELQPEAIALYGSSGYARIDGFGHYACHEGALFFGKTVGAVASR